MDGEQGGGGENEEQEEATQGGWQDAEKESKVDKKKSDYEPAGGCRITWVEV